MKTDARQRQKIWEALPREIRGLLSDPETTERIEAIGAKHGLTEMECGFLVSITGKLLRGIIPPTEFVKEVEKNIDVSRDKSMLIAQDLNRSLFNDIKDSLKRLHGMGGKSQAPVAPVGTVPAQFQRLTLDGFPGALPRPVAATPVISQSSTTGQVPSNWSWYGKGAPAQSRPPSTGVTSAPPPAPIVRPAGEPIRSDWGWHGKKNEVTGQIEFKRESREPETFTKGVPPHFPRAVTERFVTPPQAVTTNREEGKSALEKKLGSTFHVKGETALGSGTSVATPPRARPPQKPSRESSQTAKGRVIHVPMKPKRIEIPPVQVVQPPK